MDRKKSFKQSSIISFFGQRSAPASKPCSASGKEAGETESLVDSVASTQSSHGELPERKRPNYDQPARRGSPRLPRETHSGDAPSSSAATTVADVFAASSQSALSSLDMVPASSMSLGFPGDAGSSFQVLGHASTIPAATSPDSRTVEDPWSTPARPSTPAQGMLSLSGNVTPTRTLFGLNEGGSTASKRTALMASFSPMKTRPPAKIAKKSPTPSLRTPSDASPFSSTPNIPSSPTSPVVKKSTLNREMEIKGSDDEDDDISDSSLPDIDSFVPSKLPVSQAAASARTHAATPDGKRNRGATLRSPLPPNSRPRKFDIKTLIAHQQTDDAIAAAFRRAAEEMAAPAAKGEVNSKGLLTNSPSTVRKQFISMAGVKEETAGKALRAMERTESANSEQTCFYFFSATCKSSSEKPSPFPKVVAQGPWALLVKEGTRRRHIESGFFSKVTSQSAIPDDIFIWLLEAVRLERSRVVRSAYCEILSCGRSEQVKRLVKPEALREMCHGLGAIDDFDGERLHAVQEREAAYADRDWGTLLTHLEWLGATAHHLEQDAIQYAVSYLLRMAADRALLSNPEVLFFHQIALIELVETIEDSWWDNFCEQTAESLYRAFELDHLRVLPLQCTSSNSIKIRQLRRRLARAFFLGDPSVARQHPDDPDLLNEVIVRLGHEDFKIKRRTDYLRLRAQMQMLDIAIDDGSSTRRGQGAEEEMRFNEEIDEVARRLRGIWGSINDAGALYLSRTQAKSTIDCMEKRLTYSERTKPIPKQSLFDLPTKHEEVPSAQSRAFMQKFIGNLKKPKSAARPGGTPTISDGGSSDAEATFVTAVGD